MKFVEVLNGQIIFTTPYKNNFPVKILICKFNHPTTSNSLSFVESTVFV